MRVISHFRVLHFRCFSFQRMQLIILKKINFDHIYHISFAWQWVIRVRVIVNSFRDPFWEQHFYLLVTAGRNVLIILGTLSGVTMVSRMPLCQ